MVSSFISGNNDFLPTVFLVNFETVFAIIDASFTAQKMKFSIKDFLSKCDQIRRKLDLVTFTKEIVNGTYFLCNDCPKLGAYVLVFRSVN